MTRRAPPWRRLGLAVAILGSFGTGVATGGHLSGGERLMWTEASPDRRERIEFYGANRWRSLLAPGAEMLGHVRLTRIAGGETLGTSAAFDLQDNAEVFWERGTVQVGMAATFDRRTGRWSVED